MNDVTFILSRIESGDRAAAEELLPLVYDELRKLAAARLAFEKPGQTLQATALVHEVFLRLVRPGSQGSGDRCQESEVGNRFDGRGHFFAAAAEAMRRILVENARRKKRMRHGGERLREELTEATLALPEVHEDLIALDAALLRLAAIDPQAVKLVHLRYFAGLSVSQAADLVGISPRTADRVWAFARAWLHREISGQELSGAGESPTI